MNVNQDLIQIKNGHRMDMRNININNKKVRNALKKTLWRVFINGGR